ncbi:hypothetical protein GF373_12255 [bacterium]|nr:hypothetical protein [bacterium]
MKKDIYLPAAIGLTLVHFLFLISFYANAVSGPDTNGYFKQAERLANHGTTWYETESPLQFTAAHWLRTEEGKWISRYPPGFPLILALFYKIGGPSATIIVNPLLCSLTLLGVFLLGRTWMGSAWGLAAALAMAVNPVTNARAYAGDAHTATAFFLIWGLYALALWARHFSWIHAFIAGLLLGMIPTIRYAEGIFALAIGAFMLLNWRKEKTYLLSLVSGIVGAALPLLAMLIHNKIMLGNYLETGYNMNTSGAAMFSLQAFFQKAIPYLQEIQAQGVGLFLALGLAGMILLCAKPNTRHIGILFLALVIPSTILYMAYFFPHGATRFLMPTFFIFVLAGTWCLKFLAGQAPKGTAAATITILFFAACLGIPQSIMALHMNKMQNTQLAVISHAVQDHVKPGAILVADHNILQNMDIYGNWRLGDKSLFLASQRKGRGPRHPGPPLGKGQEDLMTELMQLDIKQERMKRYGNMENLAKDLLTWSQPNHTIYWLGAREEIERICPNVDKFQEITKIVLPVQETFLNLSGPGMGGPMTGGPGGPMMGNPTMPPNRRISAPSGDTPRNQNTSRGQRPAMRQRPGMGGRPGGMPGPGGFGAQRRSQETLILAKITLKPAKVSMSEKNN